MPKIQILPEEIRSKIAAGEVVEKPASVVKELVENAFDAKADFIKIELKDGGIKEITVYDNGEGIEPEDLKICYKHHATSKIKNLADIFKIVTFGFRGEALASISQVSELTIKSKHRTNDEAYEIKINFGKEIHFKPSKLNQGTLVIVKNLFANLPARKAFLKTPRSETIKIMEIIKGLTLCHPEIKYKVNSLTEKTEKNLFFWEGGTIKDLLAYILKLKPEDFKECYLEKAPYSIRIFLTDTSLTFSHTKYLYTLVNKRWIKDEKLNKIILNILKPYYGNLGFPAGVIFIKVPYHLIDINVHPSKWEIRFKDEKSLVLALRSVLEKFFKSQKYFYKFSSKTDFHSIKEDLPLEYTSKSELSINTNFNQKTFFSPSSYKKNYRYLGSFLNTFFLVEIQNELLIIDQHALCERVIFEDLKDKYNHTICQELLIPILINLSDSALIDLENKLKLLQKLGFEFEIIKENELILKRIPAIFNKEIKEILEKILEEPFFDPEEIKRKILAEYACKMARKKGDILPEAEIYYLIDQLFNRNLKICPHGRPLYFSLKLSEIEAKLKRT